VVCALRLLMTGAFCSVSCLSLLIRCPSFSSSGSSWSSRYSPLSHGFPFPSHTTNHGPIDHQPPSRAGASSFACTASLLGAHIWSSFRASSVLAPHPSLNLPPLLGSPYRTPSVPLSVTTRSRCVFICCAASYLLVLILPTFRDTFFVLPVIARSAFSPHFVDPDLFSGHHQPLGHGTSAVCRCQIVAHTPSACFWPTLAGLANVPSQPSNWRARRSECSSSSHCVWSWLMSLPGWHGTSKASLTLHGLPRASWRGMWLVWIRLRARTNRRVEPRRRH